MRHDWTSAAMVSLMSYDITDRVKYLLIAIFLCGLKNACQVPHKSEKEHSTGNNKIVILLLKTLV